MRIARDQTLAGVPLIAVRDALRHLKDRVFVVESLAHRLQLAPAEAVKILKVLQREGFIEPADDQSDVERWRLTLLGNFLTNASAARPVKRSTAQRALDGLLDRARRVNADERYAFWVDEVVLFGSFLTSDAATVGDVDVAIGLSWRTDDGDARQQLQRERVDAAMAEGRSFNTQFDELAWPELEVRRFLKNRSRVLSITSTSDMILDQAPHKLVYRRPGAPPSKLDHDMRNASSGTG